MVKIILKIVNVYLSFTKRISYSDIFPTNFEYIDRLILRIMKTKSKNEHNSELKKRNLFDAACVFTSYSSQLCPVLLKRQRLNQLKNEMPKQINMIPQNSQQGKSKLPREPSIKGNKGPLCITSINSRVQNCNQVQNFASQHIVRRASSIQNAKLQLSMKIINRENNQAFSKSRLMYRGRSNNLKNLCENDVDGKKAKMVAIKNHRTSVNIKLKGQNKNSRAVDDKKLQFFYRNQVVSLINALNRKQMFYQFLKGKQPRRQGLKSVQANLTALGISLSAKQIQEIFSKQLQSKGKDKGRQKFNNVTNQQLRAIKYKPKNPYPFQSKAPKQKQKQYDEDQSEQVQSIDSENQNCSFATWKKRNGISKNSKVYIIKGIYQQLRDFLKQKGWSQNQNVHSKHFDFKWTTKIGDIDFGMIKNWQKVNHFNNNHHLTSKYGLSRRLRTLIIEHRIDIDRFYPRCFDIGDQPDMQNFIENFKFSYAQSFARKFLSEQQCKVSKALFYKLILSIELIQRKIERLSFKVEEINQIRFESVIISATQWTILTQQLSEQWIEQYAKKQFKKFKIWSLFQEKISDIFSAKLMPQKEKTLTQYFRNILEPFLKKVQESDPQAQISGIRNVWIAKPNFLSRGRGIKCFNNIFEIADYTLGKEVQFVVQKYIENPFLINGRKFDIRIWVYIEDYSPSKIWVYQDSYLRFSADQYDLDDFKNRFVHLTNHSIQKHHKKVKEKLALKGEKSKQGDTNFQQLDFEASMWTIGQFRTYLTKVLQLPQEIWKSIQQRIKNIIVWSIKSCQGVVTARKGSCQLVGYDFMIDEHFNPWLIQINMSPSMDTGTPVTKKLVRNLMHDVAQIIDFRFKNISQNILTEQKRSHTKLQRNQQVKDAVIKKQAQRHGKFCLIYQKDEDLNRYSLYKF